MAEKQPALMASVPQVDPTFPSVQQVAPVVRATRQCGGTGSRGLQTAFHPRRPPTPSTSYLGPEGELGGGMGETTFVLPIYLKRPN